MLSTKLAVNSKEDHSPEGVPVAAMVNFRFAIFSSESKSVNQNKSAYLFHNRQA